MMSRLLRAATLVARPGSAALKPLRVASMAAARQRLFSSGKERKADMFCMQCEQTEKQTGCTTVGVCGKTSDVANLQDLLLHCVKGTSSYTSALRKLGAGEEKLDRKVDEAVFATLTNVNFDKNRMVSYIREIEAVRNEAKAAYIAACKAKGQTPVKMPASADFTLPTTNDPAAFDKASEECSVLVRRDKFGADAGGLQELCMYGLKGTIAYFFHAKAVGLVAPEIDLLLSESLAELNAIEDADNADAGQILALALKIGGINLKVMEGLDNAHTTRYGHPEPAKINYVPKEGPAILVSGHDLVDLEHILKQTEGKGVSVYTHGEMLSSHGYPGLRKYKHLAGQFGGPWQMQKFEFNSFPGPIVMTSNCIVEPLKSYKERVFTKNMVGFEGVKHLADDNFKPVIDMAVELGGFDKDDVKEFAKKKDYGVTTGFARNTIMSVADKVIAGVKDKKISHFFVIGGCDGSEGERNYFTELAKKSPSDSILLTLGCGKYRINKLELGAIGGIPRVLDMGQCNDAYSGIAVAVALSKAFNCSVNELPLSFAVSWFEQKAVAVLLTLLHLGIKNIRLGPNLPAFVTPNMLNILVEKYAIKPTGDVNVDLANMMKNA